LITLRRSKGGGSQIRSTSSAIPTPQAFTHYAVREGSADAHRFGVVANEEGL